MFEHCRMCHANWQSGNEVFKMMAELRLVTPLAKAGERAVLLNKVNVNRPLIA